MPRSNRALIRSLALTPSLSANSRRVIPSEIVTVPTGGALRNESSLPPSAWMFSSSRRWARRLRRALGEMSSSSSRSLSEPLNTVRFGSGAMRGGTLPFGFLAPRRSRSDGRSDREGGGAPGRLGVSGRGPTGEVGRGRVPVSRNTGFEGRCAPVALGAVPTGLPIGGAGGAGTGGLTGAAATGAVTAGAAWGAATAGASRGVSTTSAGRRACASAAAAAAAVRARSGRSLAGSVWMRGSTFWIRVRGRPGRSGLTIGRRAATGGGAWVRLRCTSAGAGSSRKITSRGWGNFLPWMIAWRISESMWASSPSTRTPIDFSLKTRSWFEMLSIRARSWTRIFPMVAQCSLSLPRCGSASGLVVALGSFGLGRLSFGIGGRGVRGPLALAVLESPGESGHEVVVGHRFAARRRGPLEPGGELRGRGVRAQLGLLLGPGEQCLSGLGLDAGDRRQCALLRAQELVDGAVAGLGEQVGGLRVDAGCLGDLRRFHLFRLGGAEGRLEHAGERVGDLVLDVGLEIG